MGACYTDKSILHGVLTLSLVSLNILNLVQNFIIVSTLFLEVIVIS